MEQEQRSFEFDIQFFDLDAKYLAKYLLSTFNE
jgi:hypothetical protein